MKQNAQQELGILSLQGLVVSGNRHYMDMVGYQAIGQYLAFVFRAVFAQLGQIRYAVHFVKENILALVAALSNVVRGTGKHRTGNTWHELRIASLEKVFVPNGTYLRENPAGAKRRAGIQSFVYLPGFSPPRE